MERKKTLQILKSVGCLKKVVVPKPRMVKIEPKIIDCILLIDCASNSCAY